MQLDRNFPASTTLARLETRWHHPWLVAGLSHWGQHHAEIGLPNQDAFAFGAVGKTTWLALADGVSSAPASGDGAAFVTAAFGAEIESRLRRRWPVAEEHVRNALDTVRLRLNRHAMQEQRLVTDYATTLLVAVLSENSVTVAKIGDGYILAVERQRRDSVLVPLAENGMQREGGEVIDLTHPDWRRYLAVRHIADRQAAGIVTVALGSDGCSRYFVRTADAAVPNERRAVLNADLIDQHFAESLTKLGPRCLFVYLANLMGNRQFVDEGDDRTLLIATSLMTEDPHAGI